MDQTTESFFDLLVVQSIDLEEFSVDLLGITSGGFWVHGSHRREIVLGRNQDGWWQSVGVVLLDKINPRVKSGEG